MKLIIKGKKNCLNRIQSPEISILQIPLKNGDNIKIFSHEQKLRESTTSSPALCEC